MRSYKGYINLFAKCAILVLVTILSIRCTDIGSVGENYVPLDQDISSGNLDFAATDSQGRSIFTARSYRSNLINTANQGGLSLGAQKDEYFGTRYTGFLSQYTPDYDLDSDIYGYDPMLDSLIFFLELSEYSGDTTAIIKYDVYELQDNTIFGDYHDEDAYLEVASPDALEELERSGVLSDILCSFYFPDQDAVVSNREVYLTSGYAAVAAADVTAAGFDFTDRLMHKTGSANTDMYDYEYEYVGFTDYFNGLYIIPSQDQPYIDTKDSGGAFYRFDISTAGFGFYARNKFEDAPQFIKDTVSMSYSFYNSYVETQSNSVGVSFRDDTLAESDIKTADKSSTDVASNHRMLVEALGGIVTEITLEQNLFEEFKDVIDAGNPDDLSEVYSDIFFNTATLSIYVLDADATTGYGVYVNEYLSGVDLDELPSRLALYSVYTNFLDANDDLLTEAAIDYDYEYETTYGLVSNFDGYLNRSRGCYVMNIPLHLQSIWTEYNDAMTARDWVAYTQEEWDDLEWNKVYLAPAMTLISSSKYAVLQGSYDGVVDNLAPMRLQINYTLLKK